ncbi:GNAT family N-acetyltransferase [Paenibacillus sp. L3-i20]|uniref:GNAT family N-acetyltransferase n=1 Tax=Paenibacillus sp. L3-i20 TaxID=2905833 RepID=UPI001EE0DF81|nr:GNAT family N-acetyltransferase [Paenibacillus sp. L3-i20]GKU76809.1 hypothetical protein L3i20_v212060 [Paenibacillus sp. L3-i20]
MYKKLIKQEQHFYDYSITPLRSEDVLFIKQWRNEQMDVLRQKKWITDEDQLNYYSKVVVPTFTEEEPRMMLFSYMSNGSLIGYGGLTNIDWDNKRAEISYLVNTNRSYESNKEIYINDFGSFLEIIKYISFHEIGLNRLYTETFNIRELHISILEKHGFKYEGAMRQHVNINGNFVDSLLHGCLRGEVHV